MNAKAFFSWSVGADADSRAQVLYLEQGGLTLQDARAYLVPGEAAQPRALAALAARVFALAGTPAADAAARAARVVEVETALAQMHLSHAAERAARSLPPLSVAQVAAGMAEGGGLDWRALLLAMGVPPALVAGDARVLRVLDVAFFKVRAPPPLPCRVPCCQRRPARICCCLGCCASSLSASVPRAGALLLPRPAPACVL
jgi:predicted metalloendopeptidase